MTPAARLQAAIEILDGLANTAQPADGYLRDWFRARRFAGVKDRAAITERVYGVLRHRASLAWRMSTGDGRALVLASLLAEKERTDAIARLFSGEGHAPSVLSDDERRALDAAPPGKPPPHIQGEYPLWLEPELLRTFGADLPAEMSAMNARASVDLRVNTLRAARDDMLVGLRSLEIAAEPTPFSPVGIRIASGEGLGVLQHTQFFQTGAFEFQDEASQLVTCLCGAKPGQRVLDLAAGAGGKVLALAALMRNRGEILAFDIDARRLKQLPPRARRAGATIVRIAETRGGPAWGNGMFDVVLVDAPCSGSGTWRRSPEQKWRLTPARLDELRQLQSGLIDEGARHTKAGGRLVYVTCSLLTSENEDVCRAFLERHPAFRIVPAVRAWSDAGLSQPAPLGVGEYFRASPYRTATDGFFACIIQRTG
jgi:16S rRNA (cytosine967-C5)-methyltransferase